MTGYLSGAQQGRAPYHLLISLDVCTCAHPTEVMGTARALEKLIPAAVGYWSLYVGFWGHLPRLLSVSIVDVRDGAVMWRNGKQLLQEDAHGKIQHNGQPDPHAGAGRPDRGGIPRTRHVRTHVYGQ